MLQEVKQTHEEKVKMYQKSKKKDLIEMLISANDFIKERGPIIHQENVDPKISGAWDFSALHPWAFTQGVLQWIEPPGKGDIFTIKETKLTLREAVRLSIMKWEWIIKNNGSAVGLTSAYLELKKIRNQCGLCEFCVKENGSLDCIKCPLYIDGISCGFIGHPWKTWNSDSTKANAQKVLDLINKIVLTGKDTFELLDENNKVRNKDGDVVGCVANVPLFDKDEEIKITFTGSPLLAPGIPFSDYAGDTVTLNVEPPSKLTLKKAIKLSIMKWEYIVGNNGNIWELTKVHPELKEFASYCGLCGFYKPHEGGNCGECPLIINGNTCGRGSHPYRVWNDYSTKENAQKMLDAIKDIQYVWVDINKKDGKKLNLNINKPFKNLSVSVNEGLIIKSISLLPEGRELYIDDKNEKKYKCSYENDVLKIMKRVKRK